MFGWTGVERGEAARGRCAGKVLTCDGRVKTENVNGGVDITRLCELDATVRIWAPFPLDSAGQLRASNGGRGPWVSGWGASARRSTAPGEGGTCRLMVAAAAA